MRGVLIATLGLSLFLTGCGHKPDPYAMKPGPVHEWARKQTTPKEADESLGQEVAILSNSFAFKFFSAIDKPGENVVFSPFSITSTLAITANGAAGDSRKLICDVLGDKGGVKPLNGGMWDLMTVLHSGNDCPVAITNSVWLAAPNPPQNEFVKTIQESYAGSVETDLPKGTRGAEVINAWVAKQTDGMIDRLFDSLDDDDQVVIANAAVFKGRWQTEFDPSVTTEGPFTKSNNKVLSVSYMIHESKPFAYAAVNGARWLQLPYKAKDFSMVLILPDSGSPANYLRKQTWESWGYAMGELQTSRPLVKIPRFTIRANYDLTESLPKVGLGKLLKDIDLSGIAKGLEVQTISKAVHAAYIEVTEQGTRAAAVTGESAAGASFASPDSFIADRPFVFAIVHRHTGAILFLGVCNDPTHSAETPIGRKDDEHVFISTN